MYGPLLGLSHGTTPVAVTTNKNLKMSSFKSSTNIQKKESGPDSYEMLLLHSYRILSCTLEPILGLSYNDLASKASGVGIRDEFALKA